MGTTSRAPACGGRLSAQHGGDCRGGERVQGAGNCRASRGTGTGLCGGMVSVTPSVPDTARMKKVLEVDLRILWAAIESGVPNLSLSDAIASSIYHYALRSQQPAGEHHRRQRRDQCGRAAHAQIWRDGESYSGRRGCAGGWNGAYGRGPRGGGQTFGADVAGLICENCGNPRHYFKSVVPPDSQSDRFPHRTGNL